MKIIITEEQYKNLVEQNSVIKVSKNYELDDMITKYCSTNVQASKELVDKSFEEFLPKLNEFITKYFNNIVEKYDQDEYFKWFSSDIKNMDKAIRKYLIGESSKLYYSYFGYGNPVDLQSISINLFNYLYKIILKKLESPLVKTTVGMMITKKNLPDVLRSTDHVMSSNLSVIKLLVRQSIMVKPLLHINTNKTLLSELPRCKKLLVTTDSNGNEIPPYHPYVRYKNYPYITKDLPQSLKPLFQSQINNIKKILTTLS